MIKRSKNHVGGEDSDGYGKLLQLVGEYTEVICSREEHAAERSNPTITCTATPHM
jgi:hypothetical protein